MLLAKRTQGLFKSAFSPSRLLASDSSVSQRTALYDFHVQHGGKMVPFAGWDMPVQYSNLGLIASHIHTREKASLFDVGHMLQTRWVGKDKTDFLESLVVADLQALAVGSSTLSVFTNSNGGIIDDTVINKRESDFYVVSNAGCAEKDLKHMTEALKIWKAKGRDVDMELLDYSLVALQGPESVKVLSSLTGLDLKSMGFMTARPMTIKGVPIYVSRCGYTGEDGFEIQIPQKHAVNVCSLLMQSEFVELAGLGARDSLRLEAGLCLYGHDLDETITPVEAGLTWTIGQRRRKEGGFLGSEKVLSQIGKGAQVSRRRVGLIVQGAPARGMFSPFLGSLDLASDKETAEIFSSTGALVGKVTSGCPSPVLKQNIAMGYVADGFHKKGTELQVKVRNRLQKAEVVKMPFVEHHYYKL